MPSVADTHSKRLSWWLHLSTPWRAAFGAAVLGHTEQPTAEELENLWQAPALRFAGPQAPYPNTRVALTDLSGLKGMSNLEVLVVTHHSLETLEEVADLVKLKSLFVNNNQLRSLAGIEALTELEQLYVQVNQIESLEPVRPLTKLKEIYINFNALKTLEGITPKHTQALKAFFCLPNEHLPDREIIRVEGRMGIRCRSL